MKPRAPASSVRSKYGDRRTVYESGSCSRTARAHASGAVSKHWASRAVRPSRSSTILAAAQRALLEGILGDAVLGEQVGEGVVVEAVPRVANRLQCLVR
jgi:hypothetical protein